MVAQYNRFWIRNVGLVYTGQIAYFFFSLSFYYFARVVFVVIMAKFEFVCYIFIFVFKCQDGSFVYFYCLFIFISISIVIYIGFFVSVDIVIYFIDYFFVENFEQNYFCMRIKYLFNSCFVCFVFGFQFFIFKFFVCLNQNVSGFIR